VAIFPQPSQSELAAVKRRIALHRNEHRDIAIYLVLGLLWPFAAACALVLGLIWAASHKAS
jgi:hypothetical protein